MDIQTYLDTLKSYEPSMIRTRRDLHRHAETGWLEYRTTALLIKKLKEHRIPVKYGKEIINKDYLWAYPSESVRKSAIDRALAEGADPEIIEKMDGFTGLCAVIETGTPGPVLALRFDIDCNDVTESTDADRQPVKDGFCSIHDGSMHACGHDGHASLGLHTCIALNEIKNDLCGTIKVIFQPAEEGVRGAQSIAEGGILDDVDYLLTGHLGMGWNTGSLVALSKGFLSTTKVDAEFKGVSAHAGMSPQDGKNAILAACSATLAMHTACQDSRGASRINVGTIQGGSGRNVVPADAMIRFETRGETADIQELVLKKAMSAVNGAAEMFDCSVDTKIMGSASSADSSAELEPFIRAGAARVPELTNYVKEAAFSGSEDATYLMAKVQSHGGKAAYMCIGSNIAAPHHNDHFNFDESSLLTGLRLYVSTVWEIMHR